jgi:hypothetical protein
MHGEPQFKSCGFCYYVDITKKWEVWIPDLNDIIQCGPNISLNHMRSFLLKDGSVYL